MSETDSQSPPPDRKGFERRWIKNTRYNGPERRRGGDRRRHPPVKEPRWMGKDTTKEKDSAKETNSTEETNSAEETPPGKFRPYRP
jgi:hypothetical protein